MIPTEVMEEHMEICRNCKERNIVGQMADIWVDWLDCMWDCPNDYIHWKEQHQ